MDTPETEALWIRYGDGDDAARDELVRLYEPFARHLAKRFAAKAPKHQDLDDLISCAHHSLLDAIEKFDISKGYQFRTYATRRIQGGIADELRRRDPLSRGVRKRVKELAAAQEWGWEQAGRTLTVPELAELLGETPASIHELLVQQQTLTADIDEYVEALVAADDADAESLAGETELRDWLAEALCRLPVDERAFISLHYLEETSLTDLSSQVEYGDRWCRIIRHRAISRLTQSWA